MLRNKIIWGWICRTIIWPYVTKYFSGFYLQYNDKWSGFFFLGLIPLAFIIAFSGLELGIAFIQAQVFVVLTSGYIKDAIDLH